MASSVNVAAKHLFNAMSSVMILEIFDVWGFRSKLRKFYDGYSLVQSMLLDVNYESELYRNVSDPMQFFLNGLKEFVYEADDLFDEIITLNELQMLKSSSKLGKKWFGKALLFPVKNQLIQPYRFLQNFEDLEKKLYNLIEMKKNFGLISDLHRSEEKRMFPEIWVIAMDIIGRENDEGAIIDMLLNPHGSNKDACFIDMVLNPHGSNKDACFLSIVGMGGLGKTALAQLVYDDDDIKRWFPESRYWVSVGEQFDVRTILCEILEVSTSGKVNRTSPMELLQSEFQKRFRGQKYFLVLDDVWNEDRQKWLELKSLLMLGREGSKIVITTRSERTAKMIGYDLYKLEGLSLENSWRLFEMNAFGRVHKQDNHQKFVEIGKKIVQKCYGNPLAIRVLAGLLSCQDNIYAWRKFEEIELADIENGHNLIFSSLMTSYQNLSPSLQSCFTYCALFPKDCAIEKGMLLDLWRAQGYVVPYKINQPMEDAAEEHLFVLLQRSFFKDIKRDEYGNVKYVTMHGLMHDLARYVGREEIHVATSSMNSLGDNNHHMHCVCDKFPDCLHNSNIRSYVSRCHKNPLADEQVKNWRRLRVLELSFSGLERLPDSIGDLIHLRYLNLSSNDSLEVVSDSITKLHNLQTLDLHDCSMLKELPISFTKLVKLRRLHLYGCDQLTVMPSGMSKLTSLRMLSLFVVGKRISASVIDELEDLIALTDIKGSLCIKIGENYRGVNDREKEYLTNMKHLVEVTIEFDPRGSCVEPEVVLGALQPHQNLIGLILYNYTGEIIPRRWGSAWAISLPSLIKIDISYSVNLKQLLVLSKLPYLKSLRLHKLYNLEYIEYTRSDTSSEIEEPESAIFFPSLESLHIRDLKRLKGWCKREGSIDDDDHSMRMRFRFPRLSKLAIWWCPELTSFPPCPSLEELQFHENNELLQIIVQDDAADGSSRLRHLSIDNMSYLRSLLTDGSSGFSTADCEIESLSEAEDMLASCSSPVQGRINSLSSSKRRLPGWRALEQLTGLESLTMLSDERLSVSEDNDADSEMLWKCFHQSLHSLEFQYHKNMTSLPKGIQYLTSLRTLQLYDCCSLKEIPEWISCLSSLQSVSINYCPSLRVLPEAMQNLTSLQRLEISDCPDLSERCREPYGRDWHKIKHISYIVLHVKGSLVSR